MTRATRRTLALLTMSLALAAASVAQAKGSGRNPPGPKPVPTAEPASQPLSIDQLWQRLLSWWAH